MKGAVVLAERMRQSIENMEILINGVVSHVTLSMGVATCSAGTVKCAKETFIAAADKALYQSKNKGRNKISATSISPQGLLPKNE